MGKERWRTGVAGEEVSPHPGIPEVAVGAQTCSLTPLYTARRDKGALAMLKGELKGRVKIESPRESSLGRVRPIVLSSGTGKDYNSGNGNKKHREDFTKYVKTSRPGNMPGRSGFFVAPRASRRALLSALSHSPEVFPVAIQS